MCYGARYYDPRTSVWQSVDPILNEYMSGQINGGVFNPKNLNMFGYTYNNPVNYTDPDGEFVFTAILLIGAAVTAYDTYNTYGDAGGGVAGLKAAGKTLATDAAITVVTGGAGKLASKFIPDSVKNKVINAVAKRFGKNADNSVRGADSAVNNANKIKLNKQLASQEQLGELNSGIAERISGAGTKTKLRDAPRLSSEYGGNPDDWAKIRSSNKKHSDGFNQETHAYQNTETNQIVEHKTKLEGH